VRPQYVGLLLLAFLSSAASTTLADTIHTSQLISGYTVWTAAGNDHIIVGTLTVSSTGHLQIDDGVVVKFDSGATMSVSGRLDVLGSTTGVTFTRRDPGEDWGGVYINSGGEAYVNDCTIQYATYVNAYGIYAFNAGVLSVQDSHILDCDYGILVNGVAPDIGGCTIENNLTGISIQNAANPALSTANVIQNNTSDGVVFQNCTNPSVSNQTITGHAGATGGLFMSGTGQYHIGTGNTITGNSWGLSQTMGSWPDAASAGNIPLAGNTSTDGIQVRGGSATTAATWRNIGAAFVVTLNPTVGTTGSLTVEDGVTVKFDQGNNLNVNGTMTVNGAGGGNLFTRRDPGEEWGGIWLTATATGSFTDCTIEYGSYSTGYGIYGYQSASLTVTDCNIRYCDIGILAVSLAPSIGGCTIENNLTGISIQSATSPALSTANLIQNNTNDGVVFQSCTNPSISNQTITGHAGLDGAIFMTGTGQYHIGTGNSITGNSWGLTQNIGSWPDAASAGNIPLAGNTNADGIQVRGGSTTGAAVWHDVADFVITLIPTVSAAGSLTVEDGVTVKFDQGLYLNTAGTLTVSGAGNVLFTRRDPTDEWQGLWIASGGHCDIQGATIERSTYATGYGIYAFNAVSLNVQNCNIRNCDTGILAVSVAPSIGGCTIENNLIGVSIQSATSPALSTANIIQNNTTDGVVFQSCTNPSVSNQTITGHAGLDGAIFMTGTGQYHIGTGNSITGNSWGLSQNMGSWPDAASAGNMPFAGNTNTDGIQVRGGTLTSAGTWHDIADFVVTLVPTISNTGSLTVEDGVVVKLDQGMNLNVNGTLNATGGAGGILFTKRDPGDEWGGIFLNALSSGSFQKCTVEYATYGTGYGIRAATANACALQDCVIQLCDYGIYASACAPSFKRCRIYNNLTYGIYLEGVSPATFGANLTEWNDVYGNAAPTLNRDLRNGSQDIAAPYVYWGVSAEADVENRIFHKPDNVAQGLVNFTPWTDAGHDSTYGAPQVGIGDQPELPVAFTLAQNVPNPFRAAGTRIRYALPRDAHVTLEVFDVSGRLVTVLVDEPQTAGDHEARWLPSATAAGTYFYRLKADDFVETRRLMVLD